MAENTTIQWCQHTFQPLDGLRQDLVRVPQLLRGTAHPGPHGPAPVGRRIRAAGNVCGELGQAAVLESPGPAWRPAAKGLLRLSHGLGGGPPHGGSHARTTVGSDSGDTLAGLAIADQTR